MKMFFQALIKRSNLLSGYIDNLEYSHLNRFSNIAKSGTRIE